jgi:hypothetical protein
LSACREWEIKFGIAVGRNTIENLVNAIKRATDPPLAPKVYRVDVSGKTTLVLVDKALPGTVYYALSTPFIRAGSTNQLMRHRNIGGRPV